MAKAIIADSRQPSTTEVDARAERGLEIFEERYNEVEHLENDVWMVPSSKLLSGTYLVNVRLERCECADYTYRGAHCKHIAAAKIADAKSVTCSCCSLRVLGRFTEEVAEEDELLSWFPGDVLCEECIRRGFWV